MKKLLITFCILCLVGCSKNEENIRIGYIGPLTGDAISYGTDTLHAVQLAVSSVNQAGGINGRNIDLIAEDGKCNASEAQSVATRLINISKVVAIIGGNCSTETLAIAPVVQEEGIPIIAPLSSSPAVTEAGDFVFRMYPSGALIGTIYGQYFSENNFSRIALLTEDTNFCRGLQNSVVSDFPEGKEIVFNETVIPGTKDTRSLLLRLAESKPDVLFINMQSDSAVAAIYEQARSLYPDLQIVSNDIAESNTLAETLSGSLAGMDIVAVATPDETNEKAQNFIKSFNLAFGLPLQNTSNPALAFDATNILLQVIKEVGTEGAKIKDALYMLKEYEGVMGTISFDDNGDVEGVDYGVKHWEGNTVVQTERIKVGR